LLSYTSNGRSVSIGALSLVQLQTLISRLLLQISLNSKGLLCLFRSYLPSCGRLEKFRGTLNIYFFYIYKISQNKFHKRENKILTLFCELYFTYILNNSEYIIGDIGLFYNICFLNLYYLYFSLPYFLIVQF